MSSFETTRRLQRFLRGSKNIKIRKSRGKNGITKTQFVNELLNDDEFIKSAAGKQGNELVDLVKEKANGRVLVSRAMSRQEFKSLAKPSTKPEKITIKPPPSKKSNGNPYSGIPREDRVNQAVQDTISYLTKDDIPRADLFAKYPEVSIQNMMTDMEKRYRKMDKSPKYAKLQTAGLGGINLADPKVQKILQQIFAQYEKQLAVAGTEASTEAGAAALLGEFGGAEVGALPINGVGISELRGQPREIRMAHDLLLDSSMQTEILKTAVPNLEAQLKAEAMQKEAETRIATEEAEQRKMGPSVPGKFISPEDIIVQTGTQTKTSTRGKPGKPGGGSTTGTGLRPIQPVKPKDKWEPRIIDTKDKDKRTKDDDEESESDPEGYEEELPKETKTPKNPLPIETDGKSELRPYFLVGGQDILRITEKEKLEEIRNWSLFDFVPGVVNDTADNPLTELQEKQYNFRMTNTFSNPVPQRIQRAPRNLSKNIMFEPVYKVNLPNHRFYDAHYRDNRLNDQERYFLTDRIDKIDRPHENPEVIGLPFTSSVRRSNSVMFGLSSKGL